MQPQPCSWPSRWFDICPFFPGVHLIGILAVHIHYSFLNTNEAAVLVHIPLLPN